MPNDFKKYSQMAMPFESSEAADAALQIFYELVEKAREQCKITDVHIIAKVTMITKDGEGAAMSSIHIGNSFEAEAMCAWGYGQESANRQTMIAQLLKGK
jgi:hypothetical protein